MVAAAVKVVLSIVLVIAVVAPVAFVLVRADDSPVQSLYRTDARPVSWSDRVFLNEPIATGWLGARGVRYPNWAQRHPVAARKISRTAKRSARRYVNAPFVDVPR